MNDQKRLGNYKLLRTIGKGGFATVYLGEHIHLNTPAAIKVLRVDGNFTSKERERFLVEARMIASLHHPHIVRILDFGFENDIPFLVMDFAPYGSLFLQYQFGSILSPKLVLRYIQQISQALQFAHDQHIVHCDVKPENILLNNEKELILSDFGIAITLHTNQSTREAVGTMYYMSPEQFRGKPVPASDQYALAVVAYHWLCGHLPFRGKTIQELYHAHTYQVPARLRNFNPNLHPDIERVIFRALAKEPERRFPTMRAFALALEKAVLQPDAPELTHPLPSPIVPPIREKEVIPPSELAETEQGDDLPLLLPSLASLLPPAEPVVRGDAQKRPTVEQKEDPIESELQFLIFSDQEATILAQPTEQEITVPSPVVDDELALPVDRGSSQSSKEEVQRQKLVESLRTLTYTQHNAWVSSVAWSPNGKLLASSSWDNTAQVWMASTGSPLLTYEEHSQPVKSVAWAPDGSYLASGGWDNIVHIWDARTGLSLPEGYQHTAQVETVVWSPDGQYIASAGHDGTVQVWKATNRRTVLSYTGHHGPIWSISWSPNGKYIVSGSYDKTVQIWEALNGEHVQTYQWHKDQVTSVSWSPDGQFLASGDQEGFVYIWSTKGGQIMLRYQDEEGIVKTIGWSPDGRYVASAVKIVQVWDTRSGHSLAPILTYPGHTNWVNSLTWSPDGNRIASGSDDRTVQIWQALPI